MAQESNGSAPCVPWYFPTPANQSMYVCNPWESVAFLDHMSKVPAKNCLCMSDCSGTIYQQQIISAPFRKCDSSSLGVSKLCNLNNKDLPQPTMFGSQVLNEYRNYGWYTAALQGLKSSNRKAFKTLKYGDIFFSNPHTYDAFERDIAVVEVFFETSSIIQMGRQSRMNWIDYFATVGGLLGLVLGMGIVSFVELFWVCLRIAALKMNFQNVVP